MTQNALPSYRSQLLPSPPISDNADAAEPASRLHVLLLGDEAQRRQWTAVLGAADVVLYDDPSGLPAGQPPDVVVTQDQSFSGAESGLLRVGGQGEADVHLAASASPAELQLACRLLGEIARLRRQRQVSAEQQVRWRHEALTDPLTNRRAWDEELEVRFGALRGRGPALTASFPLDSDDTLPLTAAPDAAVVAAEVAADELALASTATSMNLLAAIVDLDDFKKVNDTEGLSTGDAVLKTAARAIAGSVRQGDFVARLGGDEFGLLLWLPDRQDGARIVDRVRTAVPRALREAGLPVVGVTAGVSIALHTLEGDESATLYERVAAALQHAKLSGKDCVHGLIPG